jgi:fibro-slime domain-containing protein
LLSNGTNCPTMQPAGRDDLFLFVNGKLVIDLGGVHKSEIGSVNLDAVVREWSM